MNENLRTAVVLEPVVAWLGGIIVVTVLGAIVCGLIFRTV